MRSLDSVFITRFTFVLLLAFLLKGCAGNGMFSYYKKEISIKTDSLDVPQLVQQNGPPDDIASVGDYTLMIWRGGHNSISIWDKLITGIPLFATDYKSSVGVVVNGEGKTIAVGKSKGRNKSLTVLGVTPLPVFTICN